MPNQQPVEQQNRAVEREHVAVAQEHPAAAHQLRAVPEEDEEFIQRAMEELGLVSDAQLEAIANLAKNTLSKARKGAQPLGAWNRAKILDLCAYADVRDMILAMFGAKGREWIEMDRRRLLNRANERLR